MAQPREPDLRLGALVSLRRGQPSAAGTFGLDGGGLDGGGRGNAPLITYDPAIPDDPWKLVAVLAHELAHLRLPAFPMAPGDRQDVGRVTDLAAAVMGFGLFGANCASNCQRFQDPLSQGWKSSRLGYLEEREWVFALAVLFELAGGEAARGFLKPCLFSDLRAAVKLLRRRPVLLAGIEGDIG